MDLSFKYDLDPVYAFRYVKEMTEESPAGLLRRPKKRRTIRIRMRDMVPDLITENTTINGKTTICYMTCFRRRKPSPLLREEE